MVIDEEAVKVIDEDNEATIYPSAFFLRVEFPPAIERALYDLAELNYEYLIKETY